MKPASAISVWVIKLEQSEFNRALREGGVQVQHAIAAGVVMLVVSPVAITAIPEMLQVFHVVRLFSIQSFQEVGVYCFTVGSHAAWVKV